MQMQQSNEVYKYEEKITPNQKLQAWLQRIALWIVLIFVLFPIVAIIGLSITKGKTFSSGRVFPTLDQITFQNYYDLIVDAHNKNPFIRWCINSIVLCLSVAAIQIAITVPAAFAFSKIKFSLRNKGLLTLLILQMFPTSMALPAIITLCLNLKKMTGGLISGTNNIFIIVALLCGGSAYNIWLMKGYMDGIPDELTEAAYVDGATTWQMFTKIILPLMRNMILVVFLFAFINAYSEIIFSLVLLKDKDSLTIAVGLRKLIKDKNDQNWTQYAAGAVMASVPVVALFMGLQKYVATGLTAGSVKG